MSIEDDLRSMARKSYGYGCWHAPYWFLGPELGMAQIENNDLTRRVEAWHYFGGGELDDCREFHFRIGETRWHGDDAMLQATWKKLLLTLMAFLGRSTDERTRLNYQMTEWGRQPGQTCVIEISGLAAHSLKVARDREAFQAERIGTIRARMREYEPKFVIMYGKSPKYQQVWEKIAKGAEPVGADGFDFARFLRFGSTLLVLAPHPVSWGTTNENWIELGSRMSRLVNPLTKVAGTSNNVDPAILPLP